MPLLSVWIITTLYLSSLPVSIPVLLWVLYNLFSLRHKAVFSKRKSDCITHLLKTPQEVPTGLKTKCSTVWLTISSPRPSPTLWGSFIGCTFRLGSLPSCVCPGKAYSNLRSHINQPPAPPPARSRWNPLPWSCISASCISVSLHFIYCCALLAFAWISL